MLIVLFLIEFSNQKTFFFDILYFFVYALQFEGLFIPMCGIHFLSGKSYVKRPCAPWNGGMGIYCLV